jgi:hypothetical protein
MLGTTAPVGIQGYTLGVVDAVAYKLDHWFSNSLRPTNYGLSVELGNDSNVEYDLQTVCVPHVMAGYAMIMSSTLHAVLWDTSHSTR